MRHQYKFPFTEGKKGKTVHSSNATPFSKSNRISLDPQYSGKNITWLSQPAFSSLFKRQELTFKGVRPITNQRSEGIPTSEP